MSMKIRPLRNDDFPDWLKLWDGNNLGQRDQDVTSETWARLMDPSMPIGGLGAEMDGRLVGLTQYVLHFTTGAIAPVCYMQDVYVAPTHRQRGIAKAMVQHLQDLGREKRWERIYWLAENNNKAAQTLYRSLGKPLNFTLHIMPLKGHKE